MSDRGYEFGTGAVARITESAPDPRRPAPLAPMQVVAAGPLLDPATRAGSVAKFLVPFVMAALISLSTLLAGPVSSAAVLTCAIAVLTAAGVWIVPHLGASGASWGKIAIAVLGAGAQYALGVLTGGITGAEWIAVVMASLAALGVGVVPNAAALPPVAARHLGR